METRCRLASKELKFKQSEMWVQDIIVAALRDEFSLVMMMMNDDEKHEAQPRVMGEENMELEW